MMKDREFGAGPLWSVCGEKAGCERGGLMAGSSFYSLISSLFWWISGARGDHNGHSDPVIS